MLAVVAAFLLLFVFSQHLNAQVEMTGTVTDERGNPLPFASVFIVGTGQGASADKAGKYFINNLKPGDYEARATYVGYEIATKNITATEAQDAMTVDFSLSEKPTSLDALTVSATRAGEKSPFTYTIINKADLESKNLGQDVPYLLDATPSVVVTSDAGAGIGYTGIRIRGTDASRINVTINGVPLNDAESQGVYWVDLPDFASSTEDIQIQRGVGTSTHGAGAFGGTINLNTSKLHEKAYGGFSGTAGSFGTWKSTVQFGSGLLFSPQSAVGSGQSGTGFTFDGRASRLVSDGYIDRASVDLKSFFASAAWVGRKSSLRANVFSGKEITYQAWNGVPVQYADIDSLRTYNSSGTEKPGEPYDNEVDDYRQTHYQLVYNQELSKNWHLNLTGHYTRGLGFFEQYKADQAPYEYFLFETCDFCEVDWHLVRRRWLDNHFYGAVWSANFRSDNNRFQIYLGGAVNKYLGDHFGQIFTVDSLSVNAPPIPPNYRYYDETGDKRDVNVFSKIQYRLASPLYAFLDLQLRRVDYGISQKNMLDPSGSYFVTNADYHFFNPKAGLFCDVNSRSSLYASFAVAQKEPNRNDFTDAPTGSFPKPERLFDTEIGYRFRNEKTIFSANFYQMTYHDQLVLTGNINDTGSPIRRNVPDSYRMGIELAFAQEFPGGFSFEGNTTLSQNKIKNFTEYIDNWETGGQIALFHGTTDIAFSPNLIAFGKLSYSATPLFKSDNQQLIFSLSGKQVGPQFIDNSSNKNTKLPAYFTSDFQVQYILKGKFFKEISLNLLVQNILDARYSSNAWTYRYFSSADYTANDPYTRSEGGDFYNLTGYYPQAGRNFLLGVKVGF